MALSDDEKKLLAELNERAKEPEKDDDYDVEIYHHDGRGARVPYKTAKSWLHEVFGIGESPASAGAGEGGGPGGDAPPAGAADGDETKGGSYFGRGKK